MATTDATLFGENEFTLRDIVLRVAAKGLEIAREGRKKGGTEGRAEAASSAAISESTVERTTERAGRQVGERLAAGETFGAPTSWNWSKDAGGKTCACAETDLTGVGMQGPNASAADGRRST